MDRRELGRRGEDVACRHLEGSGYTIIERNWRSRTGELDIIAAKGGTTVFVEVKSRSGSAFGEPEEAVTPVKVRRIRALAAEYLASAGSRGEVRFDVISVMADPRGGPGELRHLEDAF